MAELRARAAGPAPPAPAVVVVPRPAVEVVESIPRFNGATTDYAQGFIDHLNRTGDVEGWTDQQKKQVAVRRLAGTAQQWHITRGFVNDDWLAWSVALVNNFSRRLSFTEWNKMVEARRQRQGETGIEYALDKVQLCRLAPTVLDDAQIVPLLINGLNRWDHVAAMTTATPATVPFFFRQDP